MLEKSTEKVISRLFLIGIPLVTVFVLLNVFDPANAPKMLVLGALAGGIGAVALVFGSRQLWVHSKGLLAASLIFLLTSLNSVLQSDSPLTQNIYGVHARNTGFLTYFFLLIITLAASLISDKKSFGHLSVAMFIAGAFNIGYSAIVIVFGDFLPWENPANSIFGFFGNTNFMGAFLGMFIAGALAWIVGPQLKLWQRMGLILISLLAFYEALKTVAVQGVVVTSAGIFIIGFYFIRSKTKGISVVSIYSFAGLIVGIFGILGSLQKGPLAQIVYKSTVSIRGQYWHAGLEMGKANPFSGVGMDAYGDNYRLFRSIKATTTTLGPDTITNAAHNVVIDFFASGGWPLLISYLAILIITSVALVKVTMRSRTYDPKFVAIASVWLCYQLQSIISINQIGLAIWGWVLSGALIAYERVTRPPKNSTENMLNTNLQDKSPGRNVKKVKNTEQIFTPQLVGGIGIALGALLAVPPLASDMNLKSVTNPINLQTIDQQLKSGYFRPTNSFQLANAIVAFESRQAYDLAYTYARRAVEFNPNDFQSWRLFLSISKSSEAEKEFALERMKELDPRNPALFDLASVAQP
jgi:O-antigen ligase